MKVHSQTLMAMKSGCKIDTQKCYVTLEWPLMLHFKYRFNRCVAHNLCNVPSENNSACEVPLKCNFANKRSLFEDFFSSSSAVPFFNPGQNTEHCDRQPSCLIIINIQCMGFNTYCGTCNTNWC